MKVWVRMHDVTRDGPGLWPEVEVIGALGDVREFIRENWGQEELDRCDEDERFFSLSYPAERFG